MSRIVILNGPNRNQVIEIKGGEICGRDPSTEIIIYAPGVSRRHFQFVVEPDGTYIVDLNSANGTYVNNVRINRLKLSQNDMIIVGGIQLQFNTDAGAPPVDDSPGAFGGPGAETIAQPMPPSSSVIMREEEDEEAEFDHTIDASMFFQSGSGRTNKNQQEAIAALEKRLKVIYEVSQALGSTSETKELLALIMDKLFEAFPQATRGLIMTGDSVDTLVPAVVRHRDGTDNSQIPVSKTIIKAVYTQKQAILTEDAAGQFGAQMSLVNLQLNSLMCVPLISQDEVVGLVQLDTQVRARKFTPDDLELLTGIAAQAAVFIKNVSLLKARTNLQRYFSPELAYKVAKGEIELKPGGDMKTGTVFFSDIIGFTSMSHSMTPMDVITKINRYFEIMVDIIFRYHGYIDKFGGDAIMAVWGVPVSIRDEALLAVTAAIEMQNALYLFNQELKHEGRDDIQMGIGLNSGSFIAGNLGSERRMEYTVIGDQVNLAQRVEGKAGRGNVFISPSVFERTGKKVLAVQLKPTHVKGIPEPVSIFSARGVPTREADVFLMSVPFFIDGTNDEGLLVKAKRLGGGRIMGLVLLPERPTSQTLTLRFIAQESAEFKHTIQLQREVPLRTNFGCCYNGLIEAQGSMLEALVEKGVWQSSKTPDEMPRGKGYGGH